jgi:hypothetical protein
MLRRAAQERYRPRGVDTTTFIYMMLVLKIPIAALLWLVWWAIHATPEEVETGDGGSGDRWPHGRRPPRPPLPRRGAHAEPPPPAPARIRGVAAHGRDPQRT